MSTETNQDSIFQQIQQKKKYQNIDKNLINFIIRSEIPKRKNNKEIIKAVTSKLHQIGSAYFLSQPEYKSWIKELNQLPSQLNHPKVMDFCQEKMRVHSSTKERLEIKEEFFSKTFKKLSPIHSILDMACGLNPLMLPWMPVSTQVQYYASDIFTDLCEFIQGFFDHFHVQGDVFPGNLLNKVPQQRAQLALLLKTLPCLEQVDKNSTILTLKSIQARNILVSFPLHSIGGREKSMLSNYTQFFEAVLKDLNWESEKFIFKNELAYLINSELE